MTFSTPPQPTAAAASSHPNSTAGLERLHGVVERVTFHSEESGWSVLKVTPFGQATQKMTTVVIHQVKIFAGATMEFWGSWSRHPKYGEQFKAVRASETKPSSAAALEKYLGSGLIKGVGPATAKRIVDHFGKQTLEVFESQITDLLLVPGITTKKLKQIQESWEKHRAIRDVMIFLQNFGISSLFATKIYKTYGDQAIATVTSNPYRLAQDIYGIGFFSADKIALAMGFERAGMARIEAGIKHALAASRDQGHCFLEDTQITANTRELLQEDLKLEQIQNLLQVLLQSDQIKARTLLREGVKHHCYYSKKLYFDEISAANSILQALSQPVVSHPAQLESWMAQYCQQNTLQLSDEQRLAILGIAGQSFSVLTGGPGCGKTTCTRVLVAMLQAMNKQVLLTAPTGRAAQRMSEVIGAEAKTIHRLLEWAPELNNFRRNEQEPLRTDFLICDETSMLDISLAASLLKAVPAGAQVLLIGDPDQLPAVGAGEVLRDLLKSAQVPRFRLTQIFRQASSSSIIRFAHAINSGQVPAILSPLAQPQAFAHGHDCLFVDADEATREQVQFLTRARLAIEQTLKTPTGPFVQLGKQWQGRLEKTANGIEINPLDPDPLLATARESGPRPSAASPTMTSLPPSGVLRIPEKFRHVNFNDLSQAASLTEELMTVLKSVHPWSTLNYGYTAVETVMRLYTKTLPEWLGEAHPEIQVLTPQIRGTLGTAHLNEALQRIKNPPAPSKRQVEIGGKLMRVGDRVIQTRNNYELGVFNGDIGHITDLDPTELSCTVTMTGGGERQVSYGKEDLSDLALAYAITVHKSQGSEFQAVILPVMSQHFNMLFRNLIYTGLTRARKLAVFVGSRKAFAMAIHQTNQTPRQTALVELLELPD